MAAPSEFFPKDRHPQSLVPRPSRLRRLYCWATGGHVWRKFLWGGVDHPFDCDCCTKCLKFNGPLDPNRDTEIFSCHFRVIFGSSREPVEHFTL